MALYEDRVQFNAHTGLDEYDEGTRKKQVEIDMKLPVNTLIGKYKVKDVDLNVNLVEYGVLKYLREEHVKDEETLRCVWFPAAIM